MAKKWLIVGFFLVDCALLVPLLKVHGDFELHMLDVGQGDAILLKTPEQHHVLVDGGAGNAVLMELGKVMAGPFNEIDLMVLTHPHLDHMEGLIHVLERMEVHAVLMSAPSYESLVYSTFLDRVYEEGAVLYFAEANVDFVLGDLELDVLYPFNPLTGEEMGNVNNASPVIRAIYGEHSILLTGDAELEVEAELLAAGMNVQANVLKAGHHGSRTSSSLEFLEAVQPELILISAGEGNSYGHPHIETIEKASEFGIEVRRTDLEGTLSISF